MPQIKIYGLRNNIESKRFALSHAIHSALMEGIGTPNEKRFQRFIILEPEDFVFPNDRTNNYTIVEIQMFEGRSIEAKKNLIKLLYQKFAKMTDISPQDLEIIILEAPKCNWGIGGITGDQVDV